MYNRIIIFLMFLLLYSGTAHSKEFLNTVLHINFGLTYGFTYGDIIDAEQNSFYMTESYEGDTTNIRPSHYLSAYGLSVDFVPFKPIMLANEAHAVKFGLRAGYRLNYLQQDITIRYDTGNEKSYGAALIEYQSWMVGPVIHYTPLVETSDVNGEYTSTGGFTMYLLYGRLIDGALNAQPSKREAGGSVSNFSSAVTGYKIDFGIGGEIAICSVNLGLNLYYSYMNIKMNDAIDLYSALGRTSSISQYCIEIYMGIPVEWITMPRVF